MVPSIKDGFRRSSFLFVSKKSFVRKLMVSDQVNDVMLKELDFGVVEKSGAVSILYVTQKDGFGLMVF